MKLRGKIYVVISSYYLEYPKKAEPTEKMQMESKIEDLIYYRDNLQIEDKENIQKVLNELIPEYRAEQEKMELKAVIHHNM